MGPFPVDGHIYIYIKHELLCFPIWKIHFVESSEGPRRVYSFSFKFCALWMVSCVQVSYMLQVRHMSVLVPPTKLYTVGYRHRPFAISTNIELAKGSHYLHTQDSFYKQRSGSLSPKPLTVSVCNDHYLKLYTGMFVKHQVFPHLSFSGQEKCAVSGNIDQLHWRTL